MGAHRYGGSGNRFRWRQPGSHRSRNRGCPRGEACRACSSGPPERCGGELWWLDGSAPSSAPDGQPGKADRGTLGGAANADEGSGKAGRGNPTAGPAKSCPARSRRRARGARARRERPATSRPTATRANSAPRGATATGPSNAGSGGPTASRAHSASRAAATAAAYGPPAATTDSRSNS